MKLFTFSLESRYKVLIMGIV